MTRTLSRSVLAALTLPLSLSVAVLPGCNPYREGGSESSTDTNVYVSTSDSPKTIIVRDTRDRSEIWSYEIPVGTKLVVEFFQDRFDSPSRPDLMRWGEMKPDQNYGSLRNEMAIPKTRIIELQIRPTGESAPGVKPKSQPTTGPGNDPAPF